MKILFINCNALFPLNRGGTIRSFNILENLKQNHEITYISYLDDTYMSEHAIRENMELCCSEQLYLKKAWEKKFSHEFYLKLLINLFSPYPFAVSKYYSISMENLVKQVLERDHFDAVICDFLMPSLFLPEKYRKNSILFQHNIEHIIWKRHYKTEPNFLKKAYLFLQWLKMFMYEKKICLQFLACAAVSPEDRNMLKKFGVKNTRVIRTGVDTDFFKPLDIKKKQFNLVFTGSMDWIPNVDAVEYFVNLIFPKIRKEIPQATFSIVGRHPVEKVKRLTQTVEGVEVTGTVDDIRPYVGRASVYIVPLRIGGGTRIKIFEAMSMGKAVVSTTVGAEGLDINNGKDIILEDDEDNFAQIAVNLLKNDEECGRIGNAARKAIVENFDWSVAAGEFERLCRDFPYYKT